MNIKLFKLCCKSLKRRWRQIVRACIATFLAIFFITGVLLFEENMYQWQMACNKERFGDWFVLSVTRGEEDSTLSSQVFLEEPGKALTSAYIYDDKWENTKLKIGYMTDEFKKLGRIEPEEGRFPEAADEVAMDYNTLSMLGYDFEPGQIISVHYYWDNKVTGEQNKRTVQYKLVGVLRNYSSTWRAGENVPAAVVTEEAFNQIECYSLATYIYPLENSIKTDDYKLVYDNMVKGMSNTVVYNENVYNYEPWGSKWVYNYMYILVMFIGIAALTYQVIGYRNNRKVFEQKIYQIGATRWQIKCMAFMENILILVPFGILGIGAASIAGRAICLIIEQKMGITFYLFSTEVLIKGIISLIAAILVEEIVNIFTGIGSTGKAVKVKKNSKKVFEPPKKRLTAKNLNRQVQKRLSQSSGKFVMAGVRLFSFGVLLIIGICLFNICTAVNANKANEKIPDVIGYKEMDIGNFAYYFRYGEDRYKDMWSVSRSIYNKQGNTNLTQGFTKEMIESIKNVNGVEKVECSYFETQRKWSWEGMSYEKMCLDKLSVARKAGVSGKKDYGDRYLFATEYVDPTEELYNKISKYMDNNYVDYEAFKRGEQVLIFVNDNANANNEYDDTIKTGMKINYHYYTLPITSETNPLTNLDSFPYNIGILELGQGKFFDIDWADNVIGSGSYGARTEYRDVMERVCVEAAVEPTVVGIVYLTEDIKAQIQEEFKDIIPEFGYYTAIASSEMAEEACIRQNKVVADYLEMDDIPEDMKCYPVYNQFQIYYDLASAYSATANIVSVYCKENNVNYVSYAEEKAVLRTRTINAILQYGITMLAAIVVNALLFAILVKNRIEIRIQRLMLLVRLGADYKRLRHICMLETAKESLWCIFTAPLVLLVSYVIYSRNLKKLYKGI